MTFVMQIEDMREQRTGRARLTVVVFDELARGAQAILARGSEVLVEGSLAPAGLKATGARLRAVRIQARDNEGKPVLVAPSPEAKAADNTESSQRGVSATTKKSPSSEGVSATDAPSAEARKAGARKTSPRKTSPKEKSVETSARSGGSRPTTQKRKRVKSQAKPKKEESPFAFDEKDEAFDPFLTGKDEK